MNIHRNTCPREASFSTHFPFFCEPLHPVKISCECECECERERKCERQRERERECESECEFECECFLGDPQHFGTDPQHFGTDPQRFWDGKNKIRVRGRGTSCAIFHGTMVGAIRFPVNNCIGFIIQHLPKP